MGPWKTLPIDKPADMEIVWVRLNYWFGPPFLAEWNDSTKDFTEQYTGLKIPYPAWTVARWASQ